MEKLNKKYFAKMKPKKKKIEMKNIELRFPWL